MDQNKRLIVTFADSALFAKRLAKSLGARVIVAETKMYPAGEMAVHVPSRCPRHVMVVTDILEQPDSAFRACVLAQGLRAAGATRVVLVAPWIAYGRQDRAAKPGESPAGLVVATTLSRHFDRILTFDAHSRTFEHAFHGRLVNLFPIAPASLVRTSAIAVPDQGAIERGRAYAQALRLPLIVIKKHRAKRGVECTLASTTKVPSSVTLIDDMADSGSTLVCAAKLLMERGATHVSVIVTHTINSSRLQQNISDCIPSVRAAYDHTKKRIEPWAFDALVRAARLLA